METLKLYHGTEQEFDRFEPSRDFMKNGLVFFARNPHHARSFARDGILLECEVTFERLFKPWDDWRKLVPLSHRLYAFWGEYTSSYRLAIEEQARRDKATLEEVWLYYLENEHWETIEGPSTVVREIKDLGYDSIRMSDESQELIYAAMNPDNIKIIREVP